MAPSIPLVPHKMRSLDTLLEDDPPDPPDLTSMLKLNSRRIVGRGSLSVVYRCLLDHKPETMVAVKAITLPTGFDRTEMDVFMRKIKREFAIWKRLDHPNIVPLLGTACGDEFGSDHSCIVSAWMANGTLNEYIKRHGDKVGLFDRVKLIKGLVAGVGYLHSRCIVHGDLHPANILVDDDHNPRLADFGLSQTLVPLQTSLSYLYTSSSRPGAVLWTAPELLSQGLNSKLKTTATLKSDIYSLGSIILFILSGEFPWHNTVEAESRVRKLQNPPRPAWPVNIPDSVWNFIERCWSPRDPGSRPSTQDVLSFTDELEQLLRPNPASEINVVLFGALGSGKSSIINLLAGEPIAQISPDAEPCTRQPQYYQMRIGDKRFRFWETIGFSLATDAGISRLAPYKQAHRVLRNLPNGVNLVLLCAKKGAINPSLHRLYWLINNFFYGGYAPMAFVVTHFDSADETWWERNECDIADHTGIPAKSIPHACVTTVGTGSDKSKDILKELLENYAASTPPTPMRLDLSSYKTASQNLTAQCKLNNFEATGLVESFSSPLNVVFFGEAGAGKSSVINLIAGKPVAPVSSDAECNMHVASSYEINNTERLLCWETVGFKGVRNGVDLTKQAIENTIQLLNDLSGKGGVDLLVFVKRGGKLMPSERNFYKSVQERLGGGPLPIALVITHLEDHEPEQWWEAHGDNLLKELGRNVIGHACVTSASHDSQDPKLGDEVSRSRQAVQDMLKTCVSVSISGRKSILNQPPVNGSWRNRKRLGGG